MSFRARLLLATIPLALLPLVLLAAGVRRELDHRVRVQYAARADALAAVVAEDLARDGATVQARLDALRRTVAEDNRLRLALLGGGVGGRRFLLDYAPNALPLSGLDVLQIQDEDGRILSSGHFRNDYDRIDAVLPARLLALGDTPALAQVRGPRGTTLALLRVAEVEVGTRTLTVVGGRSVDASYLARLERGSGLSVTLDRAGGATAGRGTEDDGAAVVREVAVPYITQDAPRARARFVVRQSLAPLESLRRGITRWFLLATAGAAALAVALALWVSARISRPIADLAARTRRLDLDRLDTVFHGHRTDELGLLERTLGELAARLRASVTRLRDAERRATVGEIARQVNHDVRNGLVPIRNVVQHLAQLARESPAQMPGVFLERQATLDRSITYLQSLAANYARLSTTLERRPCDVNDIARHVAQGATRDGVNVHARLASSVPPVLGDPVALRRILENLISNALESLPPTGGEIVVSTHVNAAGSDGSVEIAVTDNGGGMTPAELEHIFEDFYTTRERGTGLGLSIVRRLTADLGGALRVESEPGRGTRFTIELPATPAVESEPALTTRSSP